MGFVPVLFLWPWVALDWLFTLMSSVSMLVFVAFVFVAYSRAWLLSLMDCVSILVIHFVEKGLLTYRISMEV